MPFAQENKASSFRALHQRSTVFVIANAWDIVSARILASVGFEALATSSGACAATFGRRDGMISREEALAHAEEIASATSLPVSADLEKGFGNEPEIVAETIHMAANAGLVGCSIEDATGRNDEPIFEIFHAIDRVQAAAEAAHSLPIAFTLTARAENFLHGKTDLDDTIKRLVAFENAGADVLFAPGLPDLTSVREVCLALKKPVNFMVGIRGKSFTVAKLASVGVRRISLATSLLRIAMSGLVDAALEISEKGTFEYLDRCITSPELYERLQT